MTKRELYKTARPIPKELKNKNKYTWLAYNKIIKARYLSIDDTFNKKTPINEFVKKHGSVLIMPNILNGKLVDFVIKPMDGSSSVLTFDDYGFLYGIGNLREDFKYGDPIFIVEGIGDYGALKFIKPDLDIVAVRTNSIPKSSYSFFAALTDTVVLIFDNDKGGEFHRKKIHNNFNKYGVDVSTIDQFREMKDPGEIIELIVTWQKNKEKFPQEVLKEKLKSIKEHFLGNFNLYY